VDHGRGLIRFERQLLSEGGRRKLAVLFSGSLFSALPYPTRRQRRRQLRLAVAARQGRHRVVIVTRLRGLAGFEDTLSL
jgi:hypothetical protein